MKRILTALIAVSLVAGDGAAWAQPGSQQKPPPPPQSQRDRDQDRDRDRDNTRDRDQDRDRDTARRQNPNVRQTTPRWSQGERLPQGYGKTDNNWRQRNLAQPPRGYHWECDQRRNCFLVRTTTRVISRTAWYDDRDVRWRQRYRQHYTYNDDIYYRECRSRPDPAGVLIGGIIGGLLGRATDRDDPGAVFAGIIIGGTIGAALTRDLDCDDRSYAYRTYYGAFNSGRPGIYRWNNPHNRHRGDFRVRSYYNDPYGFRCARYTHTIYLPGRRVASGQACRQPDGAWVFLN